MAVVASCRKMASERIVIIVRFSVTAGLDAGGSRVGTRCGARGVEIVNKDNDYGGFDGERDGRGRFDLRSRRWDLR